MTTTFVIIGLLIVGLGLYLAVGSYLHAPGTEDVTLRNMLLWAILIFMGSSFVMLALGASVVLTGITVVLGFASAAAALVLTINQHQHTQSS